MKLSFEGVLTLVTVLCGVAYAITCEDDSCFDLTGTEQFACCAGMTLRAYCLLKFQQNAIFLDGSCDKFKTLVPTKQPTLVPTLPPTRYIFPTQSPQSQSDYDNYFTAAPTFAPTDQFGNPTPATSPPAASGSGTNSIGLGVGIVLVLAIFGGAIYYRRSRKRRHALHETDFGTGAHQRMALDETGVDLT